MVPYSSCTNITPSTEARGMSGKSCREDWVEDDDRGSVVQSCSDMDDSETSRSTIGSSVCTGTKSASWVSNEIPGSLEVMGTSASGTSLGPSGGAGTKSGSWVSDE